MPSNPKRAVRLAFAHLSAATTIFLAGAAAVSKGWVIRGLLLMAIAVLYLLYELITSRPIRNNVPGMFRLLIAVFAIAIFLSLNEQTIKGFFRSPNISKAEPAASPTPPSETKAAPAQAAKAITTPPVAPEPSPTVPPITESSILFSGISLENQWQPKMGVVVGKEPVSHVKVSSMYYKCAMRIHVPEADNRMYQLLDKMKYKDTEIRELAPGFTGSVDVNAGTSWGSKFNPDTVFFVLGKVQWKDKRGISGETKQCFFASYHDSSEPPVNPQVGICVFSEATALERTLEDETGEQLIQRAINLSAQIKEFSVQMRKSEVDLLEKQRIERWDAANNKPRSELDSMFTQHTQEYMRQSQKDRSDFIKKFGKDIKSLASEIRFRIGYDSQLTDVELRSVNSLITLNLAGADPFGEDISALDVLVSKLRDWDQRKAGDSQ
jgi:hypothetical protein